MGAVIAGGASCLDDIASACAAGSDCGACHESLLEMLAGRAAGRRCSALAHAGAS